MIQYRMKRHWKEIAGAPLSMVRRNLGGADGGLFGLPTLKRQLSMGQNSTSSSLRRRRARVRFKVLPRLARSTCDEKPFGRGKLNLRSPWSFRMRKRLGLHKLSKFKRFDSSSQYTREWQRLFLAWLPEEDRKFLEASEGLGNSQKAEVAWLERKGYAYTEVELDAATWTRFQESSPSPKVIGVATE